VGVIGTPGTIRSGAYQRELEEGAGPAGVRVKARACPLFVPLAEEGWLSGDVPRLVAREYLGEFVRGGVDTLVLGCTHYPLLTDIIAEVVGPEVALVDSAEATVEVVAGLLEERGLLAPAGRAPSHHFFVTDVPERFVEVGERFLGWRIPSAEQVDLTF
jgi:glutamate racemase